MTRGKHIPSAGLIQNQSQIEHKKYNMQEKAKKDLHQSVFTLDQNKEIDVGVNPNKYAQVQQKGIDPYHMTTCPFCLSYERLVRFLVSDKKGKGYNRANGKCPVCGLGMKLETLAKMATWTPEDYAAWVFDYRRSGFWQKIKFPVWMDRLKLMGWTQRFWDKYKQLRGDGPDPEREKQLEEQWKNYEESQT